MLLTVAGFIFLVILFAFIVTPIFFVQIFLAVGDATVEEFDAVKGAGGSGYEKYYQVGTKLADLLLVLLDMRVLSLRFFCCCCCVWTDDSV